MSEFDPKKQTPTSDNKEGLQQTDEVVVVVRKSPQPVNRNESPYSRPVSPTQEPVGRSYNEEYED
jgi:hypothetical protein